MAFPLDIRDLLDLALKNIHSRHEISESITHYQNEIVRYACVARSSQKEDEKINAMAQKKSAEQALMRFNLLQKFFIWYDQQATKPQLDFSAFRDFASSEYCATELRYPLLTHYWKIIFTKQLGFEKNPSNIISFISEFSEPEKFFAFVLWLIEKSVSVAQISNCKIFDYFCAMNYSVDFPALQSLRHIVTYYADYDTSVSRLRTCLETMPVQISGATAVFHNTTMHHDGLLNDNETAESPEVKINNVTNTYFSTNVFGQRFSHTRLFSLPAHYPAISLPALSFTVTEENIRNLLGLFDVRALLQLITSTRIGERDSLLQILFKIAYQNNRDHLLNTVEAIMINDQVDVSICSSYLTTIVKIISKERMLALLNTHPFYVHLLSIADKVLFNPSQDQINIAVRQLLTRDALSINSLRFLAMLIESKNIKDADLSRDVRIYFFDQILRLEDIPPDFFQLLKSDSIPLDLCKMKMNDYYRELEAAFNVENPYQSLLQKWSEFLPCVNKIKRIFPEIIRTIRAYPFDLYDLQVYALMKMQQYEKMVTAAQLADFLNTMIADHSESPENDKIRIACKALWIVSDNGLLNLLKEYLQDKSLQKMLDAAEFGIKSVAILCANQIFTMQYRDALKTHYKPELLLHGIVQLHNQHILTPENFERIQDHIDPAKMASALLILNQNHILTTENGDAIQQWYDHFQGIMIDPTVVAQALVILNQENILTPDNRVMVARHARPTSLATALIDLHKGKITQNIYQLSKESDKPEWVARALMALDAAKLFALRGAEDVIKTHVDIFNFAQVLCYLQHVNILTEQNFNLVKNRTNLSTLTEALKILFTEKNLNQITFDGVRGVADPKQEAIVLCQQSPELNRHHTFSRTGGLFSPAPVPPPLPTG